jgi:hypothetical protein
MLVDASELSQPHAVYLVMTLDENLRELLFCKTPQPYLSQSFCLALRYLIL